MIYKTRAYVVTITLILMTFIFLIEGFLPDSLITKFLLNDFRSENFKIYQLITHAFFHVNFFHLIRNLFAFWVFAPKIEFILGEKNFILFLVLSCIGASLSQNTLNYFNTSRVKNFLIDFKTSPTPKKFDKYLNFYKGDIRDNYYSFLTKYYKNPNDKDLVNKSRDIASLLLDYRLNMQSMGASGIVFGILAGFASLFPNELVMALMFPVPIKIKYFAILYGIYEFYLAGKINYIDNIAHFAHLGGLVVGYIFMILWRRKYLKKK